METDIDIEVAGVHELHAVEDDSDGDLCCWVCNNAVGSAHQCVTCKKNVHVFCGEAAESEKEEGYGQKVNCFHCLKETPPARLTSAKSDIWAAFKRTANPSSSLGDKQPFAKKPKKASSEMDPHVCLDCGSEISRGRDYNKKRHWAQKHSDKPNKDYIKTM